MPLKRKSDVHDRELEKRLKKIAESEEESDKEEEEEVANGKSEEIEEDDDDEEIFEVEKILGHDFDGVSIFSIHLCSI
jgi:formylmethanofuran dehydrogenase subunit E